MECGFLSNSQEASLLATEEYQKKVAEAVKAGILEYLGRNASGPEGESRPEGESSTDAGRPEGENGPEEESGPEGEKQTEM